MVAHTTIRELGKLRKEDHKLVASQDPAQNKEKETKAKTPQTIRNNNSIDIPLLLHQN